MTRSTFRSLFALFLALLPGTGCAANPGPPPLTTDVELNAFVDALERSLETHAWQDLLARADPDHYRSQVVEHGMPEAQYVAELFGMHHVGNNIRTGARIDWADLERIESVEMEAVSDQPPYSLTGTATLTDGSTLRLQARITEAEGRYTLTGGLG